MTWAGVLLDVDEVTVPAAAEVAVVTKLPIALTALEVELVAGAAADVEAEVATEAADDDPDPDPEAAWRTQISVVILWTSVDFVSY